jgi:hypothetical protein
MLNFELHDKGATDTLGAFNNLAAKSINFAAKGIKFEAGISLL